MSSNELPMFFKNNWYTSLVSDMSRFFEALRFAVDHKQAEFELPDVGHPNEIARLFNTISTDVLDVCRMDNLVVGDLLVKINVDYDKLSVQDYIRLRQIVGCKTVTPRSTRWLRFLGFLASL